MLDDTWQQMKENLAPFFFDAGIQCPYGLPYKAVYHQALFGPVPDEIFGRFLDEGYRRNGNCLYAMACPDCQACVPIRLNSGEFKENRNQRRVWKKNRDIEVAFRPLEASDEKVALCSRFLAARYPGKEERAGDYYNSFFCNSICSSMEVSFRLDGRLIGVSVIDMGAQWLNAVYFYFDPEYAFRSPGIFNILTLISLCREMQIPWLYLGYWLAEVKAMRYKANFNPHWLRLNGEWRII